jgi:hypothetical protein
MVINMTDPISQLKKADALLAHKPNPAYEIALKENENIANKKSASNFEKRLAMSAVLLTPKYVEKDNKVDNQANYIWNTSKHGSVCGSTFIKTIEKIVDSNKSLYEKYTEAEELLKSNLSKELKLNLKNYQKNILSQAEKIIDMNNVFNEGVSVGSKSKKLVDEKFSEAKTLVVTANSNQARTLLIAKDLYKLFDEAQKLKSEINKELKAGQKLSANFNFEGIENLGKNLDYKTAELEFGRSNQQNFTGFKKNSNLQIFG